MTRNPVLDLPLDQVLRPEIALTLQQVLQIYTVGHFLRSWRSPKAQHNIERLFDTPGQARHAAQVCSAWLGVRSSHVPTSVDVTCWWREESSSGAAA